MSAPQQDLETLRLGHAIRSVRQARGLTLVALAALAGLSHPFLSQIERGLARPSLASLDRIALALGSSQVELLSGVPMPARGSSGPSLVRKGDGDRGPYGLGVATLLVRGSRPFTPMLFAADNTDPGDYHAHSEDEFLHVLSGCAVVDLGPDGTVRLSPGDSLGYDGGTPHRWSTPTGRRYRMLVVKEQPGGARLRPARGGVR